MPGTRHYTPADASELPENIKLPEDPCCDFQTLTVTESDTCASVECRGCGDKWDDCGPDE